MPNQCLTVPKTFSSSQHVFLWALLCRTMYVQSFTLEGCFHMYCWKSKILSVLTESLIKGRPTGRFVTSQIVQKPILVQYSVHLIIWKLAMYIHIRIDLKWAKCMLSVSSSYICEIKNICICIYSGICNKGEGVGVILWELYFFLQKPCRTHIWYLCMLGCGLWN